MKRAVTTLDIDVRPGERIDVSGCASVELIRKSGQLARLRVTAPRDVRIEKIGGAQIAGVPSMEVSQSG
jgi:hypothetical protein